MTDTNTTQEEEKVINVPLVTDVGDIDKWFESFVQFLRVMRIERSQLYGAVITLLLSKDLTDGDEFVVGTLSDMKFVKENYHASFSLDDGGKDMILTLHNHNQEKKEAC
jgi:hypothetical protein